MSKHTPGPWKVTLSGHDDIGRYKHQIGTNEKTTAYTYLGVPYTHDEAKSNAFLIAAAPEMLTALKLVLSQSCHALPPRVFEEINRVVNKVEGVKSNE
jgi:hypothetical protein